MKYKFITARCPVCGEVHLITLTEDQYERFQKWNRGEGLIQNLLPDIPEEKREMLISGIDSDCRGKLFPKEE